jgi:hypothetical protein
MNQKVKNLFYILIVFVITFIPNVFAADWDFCEVKGPLQVMKAAGVAIYIAKIIVPIFLILMGSVELIKVVISGDDKSFKSSINNLVKKFVAGILIFFLPTIVFLVLGMIAGATEYYNSFTNCNICFNHPNSDECKALIESALEDFPENSKMKNPSNTQYSTNTSNSGGKSSSTNSNSDDSGDYDGYCWVGDSRTRAYETNNLISSNDFIFAKDSTGYEELVSTEWPALKNKLSDNKKYIIVFNYGVNDLGNVDKYIKYYKEVVFPGISAINSNDKIILLSINPVDDAKSQYAKNSTIESFNKSINSLVENFDYASYCNTYSGISSSDWKTYLANGNGGIHYSNDGYKAIMNYVKNKC